MKKLGWIVLIIVLVFVAWRVITIMHQKAEFLKQEATEKKVAVRVTSPITGPIAKSLKFLGTVKGENQVQVFPDVPGRLLRYTVKEGQRVKKAATIALIDRSVPGMEYEPARVRSPISGVVVRHLLDQGMAVAPSIPVAIVADSRRLVVATNVGGKFFPRVKKGMKVTIILDQYPERKISGRVLRISPFVDPVSRSAYCEVSMNTSQGITIGSFANLFIHIEEKSRTLLLPRSAIIEDLTAGENSIYAVEANKARKIDIKLGIANEDTVEVLSELPLGTQVVTLGKEYLKEGTLVEIIE